MLDRMYDNAVAEVMTRCANDLQNQVALVGEIEDGIERLRDRASRTSAARPPSRGPARR